jgi:hypothetical protein
VVENSLKFKKGARIRTEGEVPRNLLAERTPSSDKSNPFHTLIHKHQFQRVPQAELPSGWDMDHSKNTRKGSSRSEEGWGNHSKSWDSQSNKFMIHIEHNTELIRILTYKIDELKELVDKLIKDAPPPPKE